MKRKSPTLAPLSNCRRGVWSRGAPLIVPAVLSVIALAGVSTRPALELGDQELALRAVEQRVAESQGERALHEKWARTRIAETATAALTQLRALIPDDCSPLIAHGLVRTAAAMCDLPVTALQIGEDRELGLAGPRDRLVAREVTAAGKAPLESLLALLARLRELGFPTAVFSLSLLRDQPSDPEFEYRIQLGLLHRAPLEVASSGLASASAQGGGAP